MAQVQVVNETNFSAEVGASELPVVVDFYADWCGPCKMIAPVLASIAGDLEGKVKIVKVNADENPGLAMQYGIMALPNLLFFKDGQVVNQVIGYANKETLSAKINELALS